MGGALLAHFFFPIPRGIALAARDPFGAFLSKTHGGINALVAHLHDAPTSYR
jgi:hypothetical protein